MTIMGLLRKTLILAKKEESYNTIATIAPPADVLSDGTVLYDDWFLHLRGSAVPPNVTRSRLGVACFPGNCTCSPYWIA